MGTAKTYMSFFIQQSDQPVWKDSLGPEDCLWEKVATLIAVQE